MIYCTAPVVLAGFDASALKKEFFLCQEISQSPLVLNLIKLVLVIGLRLGLSRSDYGC